MQIFIGCQIHRRRLLPSTTAEIALLCEGKRFLNFDHAAYGPALQTFLAQRFPDKCKYER
jgi:hypothetical protein